MVGDAQGWMPSAASNLERGERGFLDFHLIVFLHSVFVVLLFVLIFATRDRRSWKVPSGCGLLVRHRCH